MRLFTGIDVPEPVTQVLAALVDQLGPLGPSLRWSPSANFHITTKFIGEWPETRLDELQAALRALAPPPGPVEILLDGLGWFPNPHQPRIFWAAVKAPPELAMLAAATETAVAALGVAPEEKHAYRPHLTLARLGRTAPEELAALRRAVAALPSTVFGGLTASRFYLYQSEGGRYSKLAEFPFQSRPYPYSQPGVTLGMKEQLVRFAPAGAVWLLMVWLSPWAALAVLALGAGLWALVRSPVLCVCLSSLAFPFGYWLIDHPGAVYLALGAAVSLGLGWYYRDGLQIEA